MLLTSESIGGANKGFFLLASNKIQCSQIDDHSCKSKLAVRKLLEKQELLRAARLQEYFG